MLIPYKCSICGKLEPPPHSKSLMTLALVTSIFINGWRHIPNADLYCSRTGDCAIVQCPYCGWFAQIGEHTEDMCNRCKLAADMRPPRTREPLQVEDVMAEVEAILKGSNE